MTILKVINDKVYLDKKVIRLEVYRKIIIIGIAIHYHAISRMHLFKQN